MRTLIIAVMVALPWTAVAQTGTGPADRCGASGSPDAIIAACSEVLRLKPGNPIALVWRGEAYAEKGELVRAIDDLDTAIAIDANTVPAWYARCNARVQMGRLAGALEDCNEVVARNPHLSLGFDARGRVHLLAGRFDRAIADFDTALRFTPKLASALYGRGVASQRKGADGTADIAAARALEPDIAARLSRYGLK